MARRLGENSPNRAAGIIRAGVSAVAAIVFSIATLLYFHMPTYAKFASHDPAVQELVASLHVQAFFGTLAVGFMYLVVEVLGKQGRIGLLFTWITFFNWFVGLPISFFSAQSWGVWG